MKKEKEEKDLQPLSVEKAKEILEKYFKDVNVVSLDVAYPEYGKLDIHVLYEDFKPEATVRKELEAMIPYCEVQADRDISFQQGKKVFFDAWSDGEEWPMLIGGKIRDVSLRYIIYKYLEDKTL